MSKKPRHGKACSAAGAHDGAPHGKHMLHPGHKVAWTMQLTVALQTGFTHM
ncbi:hypothetical protein SXCC_03218 [Gluconacetobacter sp. SXCC-1]|nr:hypothetical protein SXCC_03218 [Gluconacetobacter sp. SXCC-1]